MFTHAASSVLRNFAWVIGRPAFISKYDVQSPLKKAAFYYYLLYLLYILYIFMLYIFYSI